MALEIIWNSPIPSKVGFFCLGSLLVEGVDGPAPKKRLVISQ